MISFVGAGPGDPELITVKGRNLLEAADVVIMRARWCPLPCSTGRPPVAPAMTAPACTSMSRCS